MVTPAGQNMTAAQMIDMCKQHTFWTWSAQGSVDPIPVVRAAGIYFWDADGKRYIDMNSQAMCSNIGHGNRRVIDAIKAQAEELAYVSPAMATRIRAEIGPLLAAHTPGDLNTFLFTISGAEANENAIKLARAFTGRHKIITRYRSYHGASAGAGTLTGDPRRWACEPGIPGVVRAFDPYCYRCTFGRTECQDGTMYCLSHIEEIIQHEGAHNVAAVFIESITGANGLIVPPPGYLKGLRELCDKYSILLICDEVMSGFGRSGTWFAVDHWGVIPDIITMAKGFTSAYLPLGCVAMSRRIAAHFETRAFSGGLTYNSHPMCLAAAVANLRVLEEDDMVGNSLRLGNVMADLHRELKERHPSVGDVRSLGLFGVIELVKNRASREPLAPFNGISPEMASLGAFFKENGLSAFLRWNYLFTIPPLCINEQQLREAFTIIDRGLDITDRAITG
jgi:taurine--2-oxoglutarate transaminase